MISFLAIDTAARVSHQSHADMCGSNGRSHGASLRVLAERNAHRHHRTVYELPATSARDGLHRHPDRQLDQRRYHTNADLLRAGVTFTTLLPADGQSGLFRDFALHRH